jgi:hypothetical protein
MTPNQTETHSMDREKWIKIGKGALIAVGGALVSYVSAQVVPQLNSATVPGAVLVAVVPVLINMARKYLEKQRESLSR